MKTLTFNFNVLLLIGLLLFPVFTFSEILVKEKEKVSADEVTDDSEKDKYKGMSEEQIKNYKKRKQAHKDYTAWRKTVTNENTQGAYYVAKHTIVCITRDGIVKTWNNLVSTGGKWSKRMIERVRGCHITQGWSVARVLEKEADSGLMKIQYMRPMASNIVDDRWVHQNFLITLDEYFSRFVK